MNLAMCLTIVASHQCPRIMAAGAAGAFGITLGYP